MGHIINGEQKNIAVPMVACNPDHFSNLGIGDDNYIVGIGSRICPDFDVIKELAKAKGRYVERADREHVYIEI